MRQIKKKGGDVKAFSRNHEGVIGESCRSLNLETMTCRVWVRHWLWMLLALSGMLAHAQVTGWVVDAETGDTLPFAYLLSQRTQQGCFSGLDGTFRTEVEPGGDSIKVSLLGYLSQTIAASPGQHLRIALVPGSIQVEDVVIVPTENPALRIVRNAIMQRNANDPQEWSHFQCTTYNKLRGWQVYAPSIPDSERIPHHLFLSETVTHRSQVRPGKVQEKIVSARLAGYPGKVIPFTAADLQDLSFYRQYVAVFGQQFLSPISPPGLHHYTFALKDTVLAGEDSIFTLQFVPARPSFDGFSGNLRIHSARWALLAVEADLVLQEPGILIQAGHVRQVYEELPGHRWVPSQLNTEIDSKSLGLGDSFRFHLSGYSAFSHCSVGDSMGSRFRPEDALVVMEGAGKEDSALQRGRERPLDAVERMTYQRLDSLGEAIGLSHVFDQIWKIVDGKLMIGPVDFLLERILTNNRVEKTRLGLGFMTNERVSKRGSIGGFAGWGFGDRAWKYGANAQLTPFGDDRLYVGGAWTHDLVESGFRRLGIQPNRGLHQDIYREGGIRNWYLHYMESTDRVEVWLGTRLPSDLGLRAARRVEWVAPAYAYGFDGDSSFRFDEVEMILRWAPGTEYAQDGSRRLLLANRAPVVLLRYTRGLATEYGDFVYHAFAASLLHSFPVFRGGKASLQLHCGWNDRPLPRSRMRVFRSNYARGNFTDLPGAFATMRYDEFAADMFAEAFLYLSPRMRWLRVGKRIQPRLHFSMAAAWGKFHATSRDLAWPFPLQAPTEGYLEPGLALTHFLPAARLDNVVSSWIRGIGVGVYYRVGAYALPDWKSNLAFRLTIARL